MASVLGRHRLDHLVDGIYMLTQSELQVSANIGTDEYVTVNELVQTVIDISGKDLEIRHIDGPVGVAARNFSKARMRALGWEAKVQFRDGIARTYAWVAGQVKEVYPTGA